MWPHSAPIVLHNFKVSQIELGKCKIDKKKYRHKNLNRKGRQLIEHQLQLYFSEFFCLLDFIVCSCLYLHIYLLWVNDGDGWLNRFHPKICISKMNEKEWDCTASVGSMDFFIALQIYLPLISIWAVHFLWLRCWCCPVYFAAINKCDPMNQCKVWRSNWSKEYINVSIKFIDVLPGSWCVYELNCFVIQHTSYQHWLILAIIMVG